MIPEPRIEQLLLAGEKAACLRVIQPELRLLLFITELRVLPSNDKNAVFLDHLKNTKAMSARKSSFPGREGEVS